MKTAQRNCEGRWGVQVQVRVSAVTPVAAVSCRSVSAVLSQTAASVASSRCHSPFSVPVPAPCLRLCSCSCHSPIAVPISLRVRGAAVKK
jgi:hypothetical protein